MEKIRVQDLTLRSPLFKVARDRIEIRHPSKIEINYANQYLIGIGDCYRFKGLENEIYITEDTVQSPDILYLNLEDAQKVQKQLRLKYIKECNEQVQKTQKIYFEAISKYWDKELSNPLKKQEEENVIPKDNVE